MLNFSITVDINNLKGQGHDAAAPMPGLRAQTGTAKTDVLGVFSNGFSWGAACTRSNPPSTQATDKISRKPEGPESFVQGCS